MGRPALLADDLFNARLYSGHVVSAAEEPVGGEAFRAATYRRTEYATASTANADWWIRSIFDRVRAFDYVALWVHNLAGKAVKLQGTLDATDFSGTYEEPLNLTLPAVATSPMNLDNGLGVLTEEGSFLIRFPVRIAKAVRLLVPAMGAGLKPQVTVRCGLSWSPGSASSPGYFDEPWHDEGDTLLIEEMVSDAGYRGRNRPARVRSGMVTHRLGSFFDYDLVRYHLRGVFGEGFPSWLVMDDEQADRAWLAVRSGEYQTYGYEGDEPYRKGGFAWVEHEPKGLS